MFFGITGLLGLTFQVSSERLLKPFFQVFPPHSYDLNRGLWKLRIKNVFSHLNKALTFQTLQSPV